jgi:formate/nitrite transporter FocA (FNT family)
MSHPSTDPGRDRRNQDQPEPSHRPTEPDQAKHHPDDHERPPQSQDDHDQREEQEIYEKTAPGPDIVYKAILSEGEEELERPTSALAWSGLAAGLAMGLSLMTEGLLRHHLPDAPWRPLVAKLGYTIGFLVVVFGRQQLFTENTLTVILPLLKRRSAHCVLNVLRLWSTVLAANVVGAAVFSFVAARTPVFDDSLKRTFLDIGAEALAPGPFAILLRAIFAGWLIALMVWLLPAAEAGRLHVVVIITYLVGLGAFSHIVAGSVETLYAVAAGHASVPRFFFHWFCPTLAGNILGGTSLVAALNHAQVTAGQGE